MGKEESFFFVVMATCRFSVLQWMASRSCVCDKTDSILAIWSRRCEHSNKTKVMKLEAGCIRGGSCGRWSEEMSSYIIITYYIHKWNSQRVNKIFFKEKLTEDLASCFQNDFNPYLEWFFK